MNKKKKVLFIISSLNFGGAQKVVSNITTSLPNEYDIDILLNTDKDIEYDYRGQIYSLNVKEPKSREGIVYQFRVFWRRLGYIRRLKRKNKYDAVVSILTSANVANVLCKTKDCKSIITEVNMPNDNPTFKEKYIVGTLTTIFYNMADCVVAETKAIADNLVLRHGVDTSKISIIPNSISVENINKLGVQPLAEGEEQVFNAKKTFVTAGRMQYQKAQWHLIRAFSRVVEEYKDAKLVIFGEGELKSMLEELISAYKLENNVLLYGFTNELDKYVSKCRAFVFPSMFEGMPTALLQAMALGIPCLVTDFYSGAREVLGDEKTPGEHIRNNLYTKWGIMSPVCSGKYLAADVPLEKEELLLAQNMIDILGNDDLRNKYSDASKKRSYDFDNSTVIKKWIEVI